MKMYFSKLAKVLLAGVVFVAVGCTDYKEDIENLDAKIENDVVAGMIEPLKADLEKAVADLEAAQAALKSELTTKHDADVKTLKDADAALDGKIAAANQSILDLQAALAAEKAALEGKIAALETALAAAEQAAKDGDAALDAKLTAEINKTKQDLQTALATEKAALEAKISALESALAAAEKAAQDANDALEAKLAAQITAIEADLEKQIADLQAKHDKDIADLKKIVDDNKAAADAQFKVVADQVAALQLKDTELEAELAKQAKLIADLDAKVDANYKELSETIEEVRKNLQEQVYANKAAIDANKASINAIIADAEQLTADVRALEQKVYGIEGDLVEHLEEYANYKALVAGKLEAMQAAHDALVARVADLEENVIPAMKAQIAKNAELANQNAAEIAKNAALFEQYKQAAQQTYEQLLAADAKLAEAIELLGGDIEEVNADLQAYKATIEGELQEHYEAYEQYKAENDQRIADAIAVENAHYLELNAKHNAQEAALAQLKALLDAEIAAREQGDAALRASIASLEDVVDALAARVAVLEAGLAELKAAHEELVGDFEAFKKQISSSLINSINALQEQIALNNAAIYGTIADLQAQHDADVAALKEADKKLHKSIENLAITLDKAIKAEAKAREEADAALQEQIDSILAMIQSVVYVPEYTDGKATIAYGNIYGINVVGHSTMIYQVYPAECADALALIDAEKLAEHLSFDLTDELKVRNATANGPKLNVVGVETVEGKPGQIAVTVIPENFGEPFLAGLVEYATSLHIVYGDADLSSCYTNLVIAEEPVENISVKILKPNNEGVIEDITNNQGKDYWETYKVVYTSTEEIIILNGHYLAFSIDGENYYNAEQFKQETGYEIVAGVHYKKSWGTKAVVGNFANLFKYFVNPTYLNPDTGYWHLLLNHNNDLTSAPGFVADGTYTYKLGSSSTSLYCSAKFEIIKEQATLELYKDKEAKTGFSYTWNYVADAAVDADKLVNGDSATEFYARTEVLDLEQVITSENFPEDTTVADVLLNSNVEVQINGVDASDMVSFSENEEGKVVLNFSHFAWGQKYPVKVYSELSNVEVTVTFDVETIDRDRTTPVKVEQTFDGYVFAKDYAFAAFDGVAPEMAINKVYTDVAALYDLTGIEEAAYLKEVFVTKAPYAVEDVIAPALAPQQILDYLFNAAGDKVSVDYAYDAWTEIPMEVTYTKNLNLWYGQEVELVVKLVISTPDIYNFKWSSVYVYVDQNNNGNLASKVHPKYTPELPTSALATFSVKQVDMDKAFNITLNGEPIIFDDIDMTNMSAYKAKLLEVYGLVAEFSLEDNYNIDFEKYNEYIEAKYPGNEEMKRRINIIDNKIEYYGNTEYVDVTAKLYIQNSNDSRVELTNHVFVSDKPEDDIYKNYRVYKFDPIQTPVAIQPNEDGVRQEITSAIIYPFNVYDYIQVYDYRDPVDAAQKEFGGYPLIDNAAQYWITGNGLNGFVDAQPLQEVYPIDLQWSHTDVPSEYVKVLRTYDPTAGETKADFDGDFVFDNTAQIRLEEDVKFNVTLTINTVWGSHPITVPFTFYQDK